MKDQVKMRHLCWISCFCGFQVLFMCFWWKHLFLYKKCHFSWKPRKPGQYVCIHALFTHTCTTKYHQIPPKYKIYLVGLPSVLYERPGQNETSVLNQLILLLFRCFSCKCATFHENQQNQVNMCVYMHHLHIHALHAPLITTKYKIYLVDLPSVLYERSGQNETSVLNQLFLWLSGAFHVLLMKAPLFIQEVPVFMKTFKTRSICVYTCTIYTYMHHQIPPKYKIYLVGPPSVLYERPGQNETSVLNQLFLLLFRCFSCAFYEKVPLFMKTNKTRSICVYTCTIYTYMHHQIPPNTTKI